VQLIFLLSFVKVSLFFHSVFADAFIERVLEQWQQAWGLAPPRVALILVKPASSGL